jgi:methenyltetrahydromethanopterin cyclohydrolase
VGEAELSVNDLAYSLVEEMINRKAELGVEVSTLDNGSLLIDGGIAGPGGFEAGLYFARVCMGGLGKVYLDSFTLEGRQIPGVRVYTDHPVLACMASQYAGWKVQRGKYFAMASGPARALAGKEEIFSKIEYRDGSERGVLVLETDSLPTEDVAEYIAESIALPPENLSLLVAPTGSIAGSVQISARIVETGIHKLEQLGFDIKKISVGWGTCPVSPPATDMIEGIGRTNDAVLYGGTAFYSVHSTDRELESLIRRVPSSSSKDHGRMFTEVFKQYGNFYDIDPLLFSPALVVINNLDTGATFTEGNLEENLLSRSFFGGIS